MDHILLSPKQTLWYEVAREVVRRPISLHIRGRMCDHLSAGWKMWKRIETISLPSNVQENNCVGVEGSLASPEASFMMKIMNRASGDPVAVRWSIKVDEHRLDGTTFVKDTADDIELLNTQLHSERLDGMTCWDGSLDNLVPAELVCQPEH